MLKGFKDMARMNLDWVLLFLYREKERSVGFDAGIEVVLKYCILLRQQDHRRELVKDNGGSQAMDVGSLNIPVVVFAV